MSTQLPAQTGKKALLVIDLQENLLNPVSPMHVESSRIELLCSRVNQTIRQYDDRGWPVLYVVNEWTNPIKNWLTGNVVKKGAPGSGIDPRIEKVNSVIYTKSVGDALTNKDLIQFLKEQGIQELTVTGAFSDACIKKTTKSGLQKGYKMTIIEDAIGARNTKAHEKAVRYFRRNGVTVSRVAAL